MKQILLLAVFTFFSNQILTAQCQSGDCTNGTGVFIYPSGAKYVGQFENGEIDGIGSCYYTDGSKYQGEWTKRFPEGRGTKTFEDGRQWTGMWQKGQPINDNGKVIVDLFPENNVDEDDGTNIQSGCLAGDCENGIGTYAYADGSKYEGQFTKGKPQGTGTFTYANNETFVGTFKGGYKHGKGVYQKGDGKQIVGEWKEGEYFGNPQLNYGKVGCVSGNCKKGAGVYVYKDKSAKYVGQFVNGMPDGDGTVHYANGEQYKGEWKNGSFNGRGVLYQMDGTKVSGYWEKGNFLRSDDRKMEDENAGEMLAQTTPKETPQGDLMTFREATDMKVWAVVIGIASYDHMPTLRYTDDDAYRIYAHLKSPEGGALKDNQVRILIDEDATKAKISQTMREVFSQAGPNDLVLLYFSGHGLKGSFLPIDFDGFNNKLDHEEVKEILESSPAKYKLCIADACHSGSLLAMKSGNVTNVLANYYKTLATAKSGTALIMSSKSNETSLESSGLRQGVFSHFLIRGLKGEADLDGNKVVTIQELFAFIDKNVQSYTGNRQSPMIEGDYDGGMTISVVRE
ncbi:MAG: hypothetical protein ACI9XO_002362 [Paraglaciecola sp.]|jgi:hypothetical protein